MKEIRTIKMVEQTLVKFIANDGKEFENENECAAYERRMDKEKCEKEFKKLKPTLISIPFTDWGCPLEVYKITLNHESDLYIIEDYMKADCSYRDVDLRYNKPTEYPCTRILLVDEGYANFSSMTVDDVKQKLLEAAAKL